MYREIKEHFKGGKNHHVGSARKKLNAHRLGPDIQRDLSKLLELISDLEGPQKMEMPESQKFKILRTLMIYEETAHFRSVYGMASYNKETFNSTIKKIKEEWDTLPYDKSEVPKAASMAPPSSDRICYKFQTDECSRPNCPFLHKIMSETGKKTKNTLPSCQVKGTNLRKVILVRRNLRENLIRETITRRIPMGCITIYH